VFVFDKMQEFMKKSKVSEEDLINKINNTGKPVSISFMSGI